MNGSGARGAQRVVAAVALLACAIALCAPSAAVAQAQPVCVPPPAGMVGWWPGDGTTLDLVGTGTGSWVGTAAYTAGEVGQAFRFDGSSYVLVPSSAALSPTAAITIDAWINPTAGSTTARIVDKITAGAGDGYLLDLLRGQLRLIVDGVSVTGATALQGGVTYHVAGAYDGATLTVYVDGVADGSFAHTGAIPVNALPLRIGADSTGAGNLFTGWIDEVELFDRALSQGEIQAIVAAGPAGKCKPEPIPASSPAALGALALVLAAAGALVLARR